MILKFPNVYLTERDFESFPALWLPWKIGKLNKKLTVEVVITVVVLLLILFHVYTDDLVDGASDLQEEDSSKQLSILDIPTKRFCYKSSEKCGQLKVCMPNRPGARKFTCEICKKCFLSLSNMRRHMYNHSETEWPYKCRRCRQKFIQSADLRVHKCCNLSLQCTVCKEQFSELDDLQQHMSNFHKDLSEVKQPFSCELCKQWFDSLFDLQYHRRRRLHNFTVKPNFCLFCEKQFSCRDDLEVHTCNRIYTCTLCNQTFINPCELKNHIHIHRRDKILICKSCNKQFKFVNNAFRHMHVHNGTQCFSCDVCGEKFHRVDSLIQHRSYHSTDEQVFTCNICQEKCTSVYTFIQHKISHCDQVPYCCDYCSNKFSDKNELEVHMYCHTEEKSYSCILCKESFLNRCELRTHMRIHRCEETNSCGVCVKKFKHRSNLVRHMRDRHAATQSFTSLSGQRLYICDVCGKHFSIASKFLSHRRIHFGKEENGSNVSKYHTPDSRQPISLTLLSNQFMSQEDIPQKIAGSVSDNQTCGSEEDRGEQVASNDDKYQLLRSKRQHKSLNRNEQRASDGQTLGSYQFISDKHHVCCVCSASFENFDELDAHLHVHRHVEVFTCKVCSKQIMRCNNFIRHMRRHFSKHEIVCSVSEEPTMCSQESMQQHISSSVFRKRSIISKDSHKPHTDIQQQISSTIKSSTRSEKQTPDSCQLVSDDDSTYICSVCSATFANFSELGAHLHVHRHVKAFRCNVCGRQIMRYNNFICHMQMHFSKQKSVCIVGEDHILASQKSNQQHFSGILCENQIAGSKDHHQPHAGIEQVGSTVTDDQSLDLNQLVSDDDRTHTCSVCSAQFVDVEELVTHLHVHRHVETFTCNVCSKQIMRCGNFIRHLRMHISNQLFACDVCGKTSYRSDLISSHMLSHAAEKQSACRTSNENVTTSSEVDQLKPSSKNYKSFSCHLCRKYFLDSAAFEEHECNDLSMQQIASGPATVQTLSSNQLTSSKGNQQQLTTDVGESRIVGSQHVMSNKDMIACSVCSKKFTKFPELETHLHIHRHRDVFTCNVCNKQIRNCSNFIRHMRIHYCIPPFICGVCGVRSHHGHDIKKHMLIHTKVQPFTCDGCGKKFARESYLRLHKCSRK